MLGILFHNVCAFGRVSCLPGPQTGRTFRCIQPWKRRPRICRFYSNKYNSLNFLNRPCSCRIQIHRSWACCNFGKFVTYVIPFGLFLIMIALCGDMSKNIVVLIYDVMGWVVFPRSTYYICLLRGNRNDFGALPAFADKCEFFSLILNNATAWH